MMSEGAGGKYTEISSWSRALNNLMTMAASRRCLKVTNALSRFSSSVSSISVLRFSTCCFAAICPARSAFSAVPPIALKTASRLLPLRAMASISSALRSLFNAFSRSVVSFITCTHLTTGLPNIFSSKYRFNSSSVFLPRGMSSTSTVVERGASISISHLVRLSTNGLFWLKMHHCTITTTYQTVAACSQQSQEPLSTFAMSNQLNLSVPAACPP
mmetsp:Transcript_45486/g.114521  ORF Transcript_45486/g.114521 Transcript_45486/m.114521 type:complete len:215 (-) Transcript_45486:1265-1909(-)